MAIRKARKARLGFESLERRDTPGSLAGGGELAEVAARAAIKAAAVTTQVFRGAGRETVTRQTRLANGAIFVQGTISGAASVVGNFTGTNVTLFSANLRVFRSIAIFSATDGSKLVVSISGTRSAGNNAQGTYTITGGNGRLAHSTGTGAVTGSLSLATKTLTFFFNGVIRKPS